MSFEEPVVAIKTLNFEGSYLNNHKELEVYQKKTAESSDQDLFSNIYFCSSFAIIPSFCLVVNRVDSKKENEDSNHEPRVQEGVGSTNSNGTSGSKDL